MVRSLLLTASVLAAVACGGSQPPADPAPRAVDIGHGTVITVENSTRRILSIPGWQIRTAGNLTLEEVLRSRGFRGSKGAAVFVDGVRVGSLDMAITTLDDVKQVDVVEGVWGGISSTTAIVIATNRR